MATALQLDIDPPQTGIIALVEANPVMVLTDKAQFSRFYEEIKRETDALDADVSTEKGRKAIASMAYKVARTKTAIDDAGKKLNEEARARINAVDEARREIRAQLDTLKDEVRAPLTAWEEAEEARTERVKAVMELLRSATAVGYEETSSEVRERLATIQAMPIDPTEFDGYHPQAMALQSTAIDALTAAAERIEAAEAKELELQRLRAAEEARLAKEAEEQAERDRIERERVEAEAVEQRRLAAEQAEADRIRQAEERAAQAARDEEARKAREAEAARQAEHEKALAEANRQREEAERVAREEREAREREDAERRAEAARVAAEQARQAEEDRKREANRAHRSRIQKAAKEAIMACGVAEPVAVDIVKAIVAGKIPAVTLAF